MDHNPLHAKHAAELISLNEAKVLVFGSNAESYVEYFVDFRCAELHVLDVISEIKQDYQHPKVTYHHISVEEMDLPDNYLT